MILVKNSRFLHCLFLFKTGPEMMIGDVKDKKEALLDNKNMYLIYPKSRIFSKGVNPMILVKNSNFLHFLFLLKTGPEMMFGDVLDRKKAFLNNKNIYLICPKNRKFSKGVNP